jgi:hypothetical protein
MKTFALRCLFGRESSIALFNGVISEIRHIVGSTLGSDVLAPQSRTSRIWTSAFETTSRVSSISARAEATRAFSQVRRAIVQLSVFNLGTRRNSRVLFVTNVRPRLREWAAMNRWFAPIILPLVFKLARMLA